MLKSLYLICSYTSWDSLHERRLSIFMWIKKIYESCDDIQQLIEMIIRGYFSFEIATLQTHAFYSKLHHNHTNRYVYNNDNTKVLFPFFLVVFDSFLMVGHFRTNAIPLNIGVTRLAYVKSNFWFLSYWSMIRVYNNYHFST